MISQYSSQSMCDMVPSDYYLFCHLKTNFRQQFYKGIELLIDHCNKSIVLVEDYTEKLYCMNFFDCIAHLTIKSFRTSQCNK